MDDVGTPEAQALVSALVGWAGGLFAIGCIVLIFRTTIQNVVAGILFKKGSELQLDQTVLISKRKARLVRVGILKTVFYMDNGKQTKMILPNSQLVELTLEVVLDAHISTDKPRRETSDGPNP